LGAYGFVGKMKFFEEISERGISHGSINCYENNSLMIKDKLGLFAIEWE
jgi:hypothetical protein